MCLLLLGRVELPQLTEASGECPEEFILRPMFSQSREGVFKSLDPP